MTKKTIVLLAAVIIFIIVIAAVNLAIKKYETQPITGPGSSVTQEQKPEAQPESAPSVSAPVENKAAEPGEDIETEPPISSTEPLLR